MWSKHKSLTSFWELSLHHITLLKSKSHRRHYLSTQPLWKRSLKLYCILGSVLTYLLLSVAAQ